MRAFALAATGIAVVGIVAVSVIRAGKRHDTMGYPWPPDSWLTPILYASAAAGVVALAAWWYVVAVQ